MNARTVLSVAAVCLLLAPVAAAEWTAFGSKEPSTSYDTPAYGPTDPMTGSTPTAYFNAFPKQSHGLILAGQNPNVGALDTHIRPPAAWGWEAVFGVWKDCNNDGYLGLGETGQAAYPAQLLLNPSICPEQNLEAANAGDIVHNDGQWVHEYFAFAMADPCVWASEEERKADSGHACAGRSPSQFLRNVQGLLLVNATVWGDSQRPDLRVDTVPGRTCALRPVPEGTTSSSGLLLRQADCSTGILNRMNDATYAVDPNDEHNLRWDDPDNAHKENHPLNFGFPVNLYGNPVEGQQGQTGLIEEDSGDAAYTYDCTGSAAVVSDPSGGALRHVGVTDPTGALPTNVANPDQDPKDPDDDTIALANDQGEYAFANFTDDSGVILSFGVAAPVVGNPTGSYYDAATQTWDAVYVGGVRVGGESVGSTGTSQDGDCDPNNENAFPVDNGDGQLDSSSTDNTAQATGKQSNDWTFRFSAGFMNPSNIDFFGAYDSGRAPPTPRATWVTEGSVIGQTPPLTPSINRTAGTVNPSNPPYYSFYASLKPADATFWGIIVPGEYTYGDEQCEGATSGIKYGWDCNPDNWYKNAASGSRTDSQYSDGSSKNAKVHDVYNYRDVDCFDSSAADVGPPTVARCA